MYTFLCKKKKKDKIGIKAIIKDYLYLIWIHFLSYHIRVRKKYVRFGSSFRVDFKRNFCVRIGYNPTVQDSTSNHYDIVYNHAGKFLILFFLKICSCLRHKKILNSFCLDFEKK